MEVPIKIRRRYTELVNYIDTQVIPDKRGWSPNTNKEMYVKNICSGMSQLLIFDFLKLTRDQSPDGYSNMIQEVVKIMIYLFGPKLSIHYEKNIKHGNTVVH